MSDTFSRALTNGRDLPAPLPPVRLEAEYRRESEAHFWDYWRVLVRHRRTVAMVFAAAVLTALVWSVTARPVFTGTAMLRIDKEEPRVLKFEQAPRDDGSESSQTQLQTYHRLLQSRALANRVIGLVGLEQNPEFSSVGRRPGQLTDVFLERLQVEPIRNTRLVKVSFQSRNPELAAKVANTMADSVIAQQLDDKKAAGRYATEFLSEQVNEARQTLQANETQLSQFLEENDILFVGADRINERVGERQSLVAQQLVDPVRCPPEGQGRADRQAEPARPGEASERGLPARGPAEPAGRPPQAGGGQARGQVPRARPDLQAGVSADAAPRPRTSPRSAGSSARRSSDSWRRSAASTGARSRTRPRSGSSWTRSAGRRQAGRPDGAVQPPAPGGGHEPRSLRGAVHPAQGDPGLLLAAALEYLGGGPGRRSGEALRPAHRAQPGDRLPGGTARRRDPRVPLRVPGYEHPRSP